MWKPIDANYEANRAGDVRRITTGRILKPWRSKTRRYVKLSTNGTPTHIDVDDLVRALFNQENPACTSSSTPVTGSNSAST